MTMLEDYPLKKKTPTATESGERLSNGLRKGARPEVVGEVLDLGSKGAGANCSAEW